MVGRVQLWRFVLVAFGISGIARAGSEAASLDDCGLTPPGEVIVAVPRRADEVPRLADEPPTVRRVLPARSSFGQFRARDGALVGKTVYLSAGHGFFSGPGVNWATQRSNYGTDVVEDLITTETVHQLLVPMLMNAGARVVTVRESDLQTAMVTVDESKPGYAEYGNSSLFSSSSAPGFGEPSYPLADGVNPFTLGATRELQSGASPSARAEWTPTLPTDGEYGVYVSYVADPGRSMGAHYVVRHPGGLAHFQVNQRRHGRTWIFLGRFFFRAGTNPAIGSVSLENDSGGGTLSIDAVRFGGGMGVIDRGPGVSGRPRFEECSRYHAQFMGAPPESVYRTSSAMTDRQDDISTRPRFAAWDHEDGEDAVYLSIHTNGLNGSVFGTETYAFGPESHTSQSQFSGYPGGRELSEAVHNELIADLRANWDATWKDRGVKTNTFAEVNPEHNGEMPSILVELGFHDNVADTRGLRDGRFRGLVARAITQGVIRYFSERDGVAVVLPPEPPSAVWARAAGAGSVTVGWGEDGSGGHPATSFRLLISEDGLAWSEGVELEARSITLQLPGLQYFRVVAINAAGESMPSRAVAVRSGDSPSRLLVVNGFDALDETLAGREDLSRFSLGTPYRLLLGQMNDGSYARHHAAALAALGHSFDGATELAVARNDVPPSGYEMIDWFVGRGGPNARAPGAAELTALTSYVMNGGNLLLSGSHLVSGLSEGGEVGNRFLGEILGAAVGTGNTALGVTAAERGPFAGMAPLTLEGMALDGYPIGPLDPMQASGSMVLAHYAGTSTPAALYLRPKGTVVFLGFPLERVASAEGRQRLMERALAAITEAQPIYVDDPLAGPAVRGKAYPSGCGCGAGNTALLPFAALLTLALRRGRRSDQRG